MADRNIYRGTMHSQASRPTPDEIAPARTKRGTGAPARCGSHKAAILALLWERGPQGVRGSELYNSPQRFGRSPRNRISELRKEGCLISGEPHADSDWHYVLLRDSSGAKPITSSDWYESQTGRARPAALPAIDLPLFAGVRP
jgi:hypothetical protein